jgi:hypothetical protein
MVLIAASRVTPVGFQGMKGGTGCLPTCVRSTRGKLQLECQIQGQWLLSFHDPVCKQTRLPNHE